METNDAAKTSAVSNKLVIAIVALIVVIVGAAAVIVYTLNNQEPAADNGLTIGYATGANVFLDEESLQAAMDESIKNSGSVSLRYKNGAYSDDGVNFSCYIANSPRNGYDMFLTIFADGALTDQLFLSGLLRPGSGFDSITLEHALEPGVNTVYVAVTLVDTAEDGTQTIKGQAFHTMDFHVLE